MSKAAAKPAATPASKHAKKVDHLLELFPQLSPDMALMLLDEYNGSVKHATEAALGGEKWLTVNKKKAPKRGKEEALPGGSPTDMKEMKPRERRPRPAKESEGKPKASEQEEAPATVHQKDVATTSWSKGKGLSFVEMVKKKKESEAQEVANCDAPELPAETKTARHDEKKESENEGPKDKPRRERKSRNHHVDATAAVTEDKPATPKPVESPVVIHQAPPPVAAPVPQPVAPPVVHYVLEFDRVTSDVTLPAHVQEMATRYGGSFVFDAVAGSPPAPPTPPPATQASQILSFGGAGHPIPQPQQQALQQPQQQRPTQSWGVDEDPRTHSHPGYLQQQSHQPPQLPSQPRYWDHPAQARDHWGRGPVNFTSYQPGPQQYQPRYAPNTYTNPRYRQMDHGASEAAYNVIRDDQQQQQQSHPSLNYRANGGTW